MRAPVLLVLAACQPPAQAQDVCRVAHDAGARYASRIAAVACTENALWFGPFIDAEGRLANAAVFEHEQHALRDGETPAWQRVAHYWESSGLLDAMAGAPGATDCHWFEGAGRPTAASCRAFISDTPWSAAFVSYVMVRAGVPGFRASPAHIDYVREAGAPRSAGPYRLADPDTTPPAVGDLLCYARMADPLGPVGLRRELANGSTHLGMHCDIVVAANPGGDNRLYLVGGNLLQSVTLRVLPLNQAGRLWGVPRRTPDDPPCEPGRESGCSFHRQDWVALLKLQPLPAPSGAWSPIDRPAGRPPCCTACPLPMPPGVQRCPPPVGPADD